MKREQAYSFQSPLSFVELSARVQELGPWLWDARGGQCVIAHMQLPDRGTVTISARPDAMVVELALESTPEMLDAIYDTVFTRLLPAIDAREIKPRRGTPAQRVRDTTTRHFAFKFDSALNLEEMFATLNATGPWPWFERDSDSLGDYISGAALSSPHRGVVKIVVEHGELVVNALFTSSEPDAASVIANAERELMERVLPSVGASNLVPTDTLD